MARTTFQGPVRSLNGFYAQGAGNVISGTGTTALTVADNAGRTIRTTAATGTYTLPTINASTQDVTAGPGSDPNTLNNIGTSYAFYIDTAATNVKIGTDGTDKFVGSLLIANSGTNAVTGWIPGATNDFINLNGTTSGGASGSWVIITAVAALKYEVTGVLVGSGVNVTPFADA